MTTFQKIISLAAASLLFAACSKPAETTDAKPNDHAAHTQEADSATATAALAQEASADQARGGGEFASGEAVVMNDDLIVVKGTEGSDGGDVVVIQ